MLTLIATTLDERPLSQPITAVFDQRGGTIGRADHNTMALPDPQRHVSRRQAEVLMQGDAFIIRNVGTANPIGVDDQLLGPGEAAPLTAQSRVRIGGYALRVQPGAAEAAPVIDAALLPPAPAQMPAAARVAAAPNHMPSLHTLQPLQFAPPLPPLQPARSVQAAPLPPMAAPVRASVAVAVPAPGAPAASARSPFADLLGPTPATAPGVAADPLSDWLAPPAGVPARSRALADPAPAAAPANMSLPEDFDPFAVTVLPSAPAAPIDPFADLMPAAGIGGSVDDWFNLTPASMPAPADPLALFVAGATDASRLPATDPLALFGAASSAAAQAAPAAHPEQDHVSALHAAFAPLHRRHATPVPTSSAAPHMAAAAAAEAPPALGDAALWEAFCTGAGITPSAGYGSAAERLQLAGHLLRRAMEGTLQLIALRASTKHELRAEVTVIQVRENNPLKFSPDAKGALEQVLSPPLRGFLDGPTAMDDAMNDLLGHAIGTVAGMRAAADGMLARFAPDALSAKLIGGSVLDNLLPMNRRARLWDLYLQHHASIREEAQEDFHKLFGKAFLEAYERQIERLRQTTPTP